jgi:hypothetical protein
MTIPSRISIHIFNPAIAIFCLVLLAASAEAQRMPNAPGSMRPPAETGPVRPPRETQPASIEERQLKMMEMEREAKQPRSEAEQRLALVQIAQDYRELQVINNKMMATSIPSAAPSFVAITRSLEEIRKRAGRLKDNLRLADPKDKTPPKTKYKQVENTAELKSQLLVLDESIMRLVKSPIFKNPEVVDVGEAAKARGELEFIIVTSQLIGKDADRLHKAADKTP